MARIHPVVLSGGSGTRLWPLSRADYPKQLLALTEADSLFIATLKRVAEAKDFAAPLLVASEALRFLLLGQCQAAGIEPQTIILEPMGRNTAPAVLAAALYLARKDPDAFMLVLPSDHLIGDLAAFHRAIATARPAAEAGRLMTFGIEPSSPDTGFGYIRRGAALPEAKGAFAIQSFAEKPSAAKASELIAEGALWNSGMFLLRADRLIEEMARHAPAVLKAVSASLASATSDGAFLRLASESFSGAPSIALDVAVMEKTDKAGVVPCELKWSDVGSWNALWQASAKDKDGNASVGDVVALEASGNYLRSQDRLVAVAGVENLVIVETGTALLVVPRDKTQLVKPLVEKLQAAGRREAVEHARVYRPWGWYESLREGPGFQVKQLTVKPGASLSLQSHRHRAEHWVVVSGLARVTCGEETFDLAANQSTYISPTQKHRLANPGKEELVVIEVQTGSYLGEDDIERYKDDYGRT